MIKSFCMSKYFKIVKDNNPSIRKRCEEVKEITPEIIDLVNKMHDYLVASQDEEIANKYHLRAGVGLAAPQIGKNIKVIAIYIPQLDKDGNDTSVDYRLINPKIISESVRLAYLGAGEGCLSVDDEHKGYVYRHFKIQVKAFDALKKKETIITATGYNAIVLQHEIDHLSGVLYYDHINKNNPFEEKVDAVRL